MYDVDEIYDIDELTHCHACESIGEWDQTFMGMLGDWAHFRCRNCGMDWSEQVLDEEAGGE